MDRKHAAGKTVVAPTAVALIVAAVRQAIVSGELLSATLLFGAGVGLFGAYHVLDERRIERVLPGDLEQHMQDALARVDADDVKTVSEDVASKLKTETQKQPPNKE